MQNFDEIPAPVLVTDGNGMIRSVNQSLLRLVGLDSDAMVAKSMEQLFPVASRLFLQTHIWPMLMHAGQVSEIRLQIQNASGTTTPLYCNCQKSGHADDASYVWIFFVTVERIHFEQELLEARQRADALSAENSRKLESTLTILHQSKEKLAISETKAMVSTLIASVSHELSTPIGNSMLAASTMTDVLHDIQQLMGDGTLRRSKLVTQLADLNACANLVERNSKRAEQLLNSFCHVAADQASEQRRSFDLAKVIQEILETLAPSLKRHPHRIELHIPVGITMDSVPGPLGQVIINLINNAYLHAFENQPAGVVTISASKTQDRVMLTVADNGVGIPAENLPKLFQEFFSTKIGRGGTGLGMAIVHNLVTTVLQGDLAVQSIDGSGTRFEINLPLVLAIGQDDPEF